MSTPCRSLASLAGQIILGMSVRKPVYPRSWQLVVLVRVAYGGSELAAYFGVSVYTGLASARRVN